MATPLEMIRGLVVTVAVALYVFFGSLIGYPMARLLRRPALLYSLGRVGGRLALWLAGIRVDVRGREHLADLRNTVVMPNHESLVDSAVIALVLPVDFKGVVKRELLKFPFFGWCLQYAGFIPVNRKDRVQAVAAMSRAVEALKAGACFLIFPEGTRTRTGELGEFKKGAFVVALEAQSRIVPVVLSGFRRLMPAEGVRVRPGVAYVRVLPPMGTDGFTYERRGELAVRVREKIRVGIEEAARKGAL